MALRHLERDCLGPRKQDWVDGMVVWGSLTKRGEGRALRMLSVEIRLKTQVSFLVS